MSPDPDSQEIQLQEGAVIITADGEKIGKVERVVVDPRSKKVTNLVLKQSNFLSSDKVVPIEWVKSADKDEVILDKPTDELQDLPDFIENHFVQVDQSTGQTVEPPVSPFMFPARMYPYPPVGITPAYYPGFFETYSVETSENIPNNTVSIKEGARVMSSDNRHVGNIERVFTNPEDDKVTHFLIEKGLLLKEHKLIPMTWVESIGADSIRLTVESDMLQELPDYKDQ